MLVELAPGAREVLRPLFHGFQPLHGTWEAALAGNFGTALVDDAFHPAVALVTLDFRFLVGDPSAPAARELVARISPPASIIAPPSWDGLLDATFGGRLHRFERVVFGCPARWDRAKLRAMASTLPPGFTMVRIDATNVVRFRELADSLVYNFASDEAFLELGAGYGVEHEGRFAAGCSSFVIGGGKLEFEIQTHPDFRQRDLATAAGARMIEHCLDAVLEPCWDAHNPPSAGLARKLGFADPFAYTAYALH